MPDKYSEREYVDWKKDSTTGIDHDYFNEYSKFITLLGTCREQAILKNTTTEDEFFGFLTKIFYGKNIIKNYEERYGATRNLDIGINEQNRERVAQLNALADEINTAWQNKTLTIEQIKEAIKKADALVFGE